MANLFHSDVEASSSTRGSQSASRQPLNLNLLTAESADASDAFRAKQMQRSNSRGTILLVSSDDDLRRMIRAYLEHTGFVVISCTGSPRSADVLAQAGGLRMMVLDVGSLESPSLQVAGEIAARSIDLPVVIIAGSNIEREEIQIIADRGWKLLKKPLRMPDLLAVVQRIFDRDAMNRSMPPLLCKIA